MKNILIITLIATFLFGCQSTPSRPAPINDSIVITTPGQNIPQEYTMFSGLWEGKWGSDLDGKFAVQSISENGHVKGVYAWGEAKGRFKEGSQAFNGRIRNGTLKLSTFDNGANVSYKAVDKNTLDGTYSLNGRDTYGVFKKKR